MGSASLPDGLKTAPGASIDCGTCADVGIEVNDDDDTDGGTAGKGCIKSDTGAEAGTGSGAGFGTGALSGKLGSGKWAIGASAGIGCCTDAGAGASDGGA